MEATEETRDGDAGWIEPDFDPHPPESRSESLDDEWITCPECEAEGEIEMEGEDGGRWDGHGRFVFGTGRTCPLCEGGMGFGDEIELTAARNRLAKKGANDGLA